MNEKIIQCMKNVDDKIENVEFSLTELKDSFEKLCNIIQED